MLVSRPHAVKTRVDQVGTGIKKGTNDTEKAGSAREGYSELEFIFPLQGWDQ
jgi:hypothetical protein